MESPQRSSSHRLAAAAFACVVGAASASAQQVREAQTDLTELSLEDLLDIEVEVVRGASRRAQSNLEAPSSVTVIDAGDLALYDRRTLAEVLRSVNGFDVTNDRNYEHVGVRGFNPLGDYNSRVLLLLDGHRLNNSIYDTATIGRDLPFDLALAKRVEIARGPGSALYGSSAFFGVVELTPRTGADVGGLELSAGSGSFGLVEGRATYGKRLDDGSEWLVSTSAYSSRGPTLFYDEFASTPSGGVTAGNDYEHGYNLYSNWTHGDWSVSGAWGSREKGIPTGSYDTVFDTDNHTTDTQGFVDVAWKPELGESTRLEARLGADRYEYDGLYTYDMTGSGGAAKEPYYDSADAFDATASVLVTTTAWDAHTTTLGAELRRNFELDQLGYDALGTYVDEERDSDVWGVFANDEWRFAENWRLHAGLRLDGATDVDQETSPRLGLVWLPDERTAWKLLYGRAFRAPNTYENYYDDGFSVVPNGALDPERIETFEFVWEHIVERVWRASVSLYHYRIDDMIVLAPDTVSGTDTFQNLEEARANGVELECERTFARGARVRASLALQKAENVTLDQELANSPRELGKLAFEAPLVGEDVWLALEARATGSRILWTRDESAGFVVLDATLFAQRIADGVEFSLGVHNLLDSDVYDPVGSEHVQDALLQDGRTLRLRLSISR